MAKKIDITFYVDEKANDINLWQMRKLFAKNFKSDFKGITKMEVENGTNA
jgi:hypothetical protein